MDDDFRSKSHNNNNNNQGSSPADNNNTCNYYSTNNGVVPYDRTSSNPSGMQDLRCYSASYASSSPAHHGHQMDIVAAGTGGGGGGEQWKFKKGKSMSSSSSKSWSFNDPELMRKKRVASYKAYTVEGKVKGSIKKSFRWIKERYSQMVYGHR